MLDLDNLSNLDNLLNSDNKNSKSTSLSLDAGSLFGDDVLSELEVVTDDMAKSNSLSKLYTSEKTKLINKINNLTGKYQEKLNSQSLSQMQDEWSQRFNMVLDSCAEFNKKANKDDFSVQVKRSLHTGKNIFINKIPRLGEFLHGLEDLFNQVQTNGDYLDLSSFINVQFIQINRFVTNLEANYQNQNYFEVLDDIDLSDADVSSEKSEDIIKVSLKDINNIISANDYIKILRTRIQDNLTVLNTNSVDLNNIVRRITDAIKSIEDYADRSIASHKNVKRDDFDPLEMDTYTELQENVNILKESRDDLETIVLDVSQELFNLDFSYRQLSNKQENIQNKVYDFRLVKISDYKSRLNDDITNALSKLKKDKEVEFVLHNNGVLIDRTLMNELMSPLGHILRNAVDHGIEEKRDRIKAGKSAQGKITITAYQEKNSVKLLIEDDGAGFNLNRIKQKAIEKGLIGANQRLNEQEIIDLILSPGFTTSDTVTDVSGRGIGLDTVKDDISKLNGTFFISSKQGSGTTFELNIPTKYVNSYGLVVVANEENYIIPNEIVKEIVLMTKATLLDSLENGYITYNKENIPLVKLSALLKLNDKLVDKEFYHLVIVRSQLNTKFKTIAVVSDLVKEIKEINAKPVPYYFDKYDEIIGYSILADGNPSYIVDPVLLNNQYHSQEVKKVEEKRVPYILIVDDSTAIRKRSEKFAKSRGYQYDSAKNGSEALRKIAEKIPDIILLDIEMGGMDEIKEMNGFDVAEFLKEHDDKRYNDINIFMITSRASEKHKQKAREIGVDEYLIKPFQEKELEQLIKQYFAKRIKGENK